MVGLCNQKQCWRRQLPSRRSVRKPRQRPPERRQPCLAPRRWVVIPTPRCSPQRSTRAVPATWVSLPNTPSQRGLFAG